VISCDLHSQYELLAMHRARVVLDADGDAPPLHDFECQVIDVLTRAGAEYLVVLDGAGERLEIRLDRLISVRPLG
jgi:transcriptional antiterminator Rof (Rho-off)